MGLSTAIDTALDRTIAPGYGNIGLLIRRKLPGWPADAGRMDGRTVLVTGAASGIGLAAVVEFARLGARVLGVVRSEERARDLTRLVAEEDTTAAARVTPMAADVSSVEAVRDLARRVAADHERLDVLVNNAGVMPDERTETADGVELTFATHVVAPYVLTLELADLLAAAAPGRVVNVTSGGMYAQRLAAHDLETREDAYAPKRVYARTKRAQMVLTEELAERLGPRGIVVHAMHPGWADTKGVRQWMPVFRAVTRPIIRTPAQGADTIVWLGGAQEPTRSNGLLWQDRRPRPTHLLGRTRESPADRQHLMEHVAAIADAATIGAGR